MVTSAAPVGVTVSPSTPAGWTGTPGNMAATAGAGSGMVPWAQSTVPASHGQARADDLVHRQLIEGETGADHIDDGVHRAHFVKVHGLGGLAVDLGLGLGQGPEDRLGHEGHGGRKLGAIDDGLDIGQIPVVGVGFGIETDGQPTCGEAPGSTRRARRW